MLKKMATGTCLDYWSAFVDPNRKPVEPTTAMLQGSIVDCKITEPEKFDDRYVVAPKGDKRKKAIKEAWEEAELIAQQKSARVIDADTNNTADQICAALRGDSFISFHLRKTGQSPHFWKDAEHQMDCRYMPDIEDPESGLLLDLKKARSANPSLFTSQAYSLGYDIQMAHYAEGYKDRYGEYPKKIVLLAYEWAYPYNASFNVVTDEFLDEGRRRRNDAMVDIFECTGINEWPSYGLHYIKPPGWIKSDLANSTSADDLELEGLS